MESENEKIPINDLEMAKKRANKIIITDMAIKKVPLIRYREIPESEYLMLQELALEVLMISKNDNDSKMMVVITNLGNISYLVKKENYNRKKAIEIFNDAVSMNNKGSNIHDYQKAASHFLSICHEANIVYEDR